MKLKKKPQPPKRKEMRVYFDVEDGDSLYKLEEKARLQGITTSEVYFSINCTVFRNYDDYDSECDTVFSGVRQETDVEFNVRVESYEKCLAKYEAWYLDNEEAIKVELAHRAEEKIETEERIKKWNKKNAIKKRLELQKELAKLEREIEE